MHYLQVKLQEADENPVIQGWRDNGVRARLVDFIDHRFEEIFKDYEHVQKALVHSDLSKLYSLATVSCMPSQL